MQTGFRRGLFLFIAAIVGLTSYYVADVWMDVHAQSVAMAQSKTVDSKRPGLDPAKLGDPLPRNLFVELSKEINPAVVSISTSVSARTRRMQMRGYRDPMQDFFDQFFGGPGGMQQPQPQQQGPQQLGMGTGFIIREDGLIITNNHVVANADIINVQLDGNSKELYDAKVIGRDDLTDVALIKINAKKPLPVAPLGSSKDLQVGEWVAAFGNPYGHAHTMTKGIISAIGREISELNRFPFLQTDASINPGNSGGPLVNTQGYVIGVNTAIDARAQGIGFAIPIDNVKTITRQLEEGGRVKRGFLGVAIQPINQQVASYLGLDKPQGALVTGITPESPAARGGVQLYDIVTEFNGKKVSSPNDLTNAVADVEIGSKVKVHVIRLVNEKKTEKNLDVTISERPTDLAANKPEETKKYFGQKAPFDLGLKISDFTPQLAQEFALPKGTPTGPIVTDVEKGSSASRSGIQAGDVILDVNRQQVRRAVDVLRLLKEGQNIVRIARGPNTMLIVPLDTKKE